HSRYEAGTSMYIGHMVWMLEGRLDRAAFQRAWQQVADRYVVFRTAILSTGLNEPLQIVRRHVQLTWNVADWRGRSPDEQEADLAAFLAEDYDRGFDLAQAPLVRLALFQTAADTYQFVWTHHHL